MNHARLVSWGPSGTSMTTASQRFERIALNSDGMSRWAAYARHRLWCRSSNSTISAPPETVVFCEGVETGTAARELGLGPERRQSAALASISFVSGVQSGAEYYHPRRGGRSERVNYTVLHLVSARGSAVARVAD